MKSKRISQKTTGNTPRIINPVQEADAANLTKNTAISILILDDDANMRKTLSDALQMKGYVVDGFKKGREALEKTAKSEYSVALIELKIARYGRAGRCA